MLSLSWNKNTEPCNSLVPDLVITVVDAPPDSPCSASPEPVVMLTVSIVSAGAM